LGHALGDLRLGVLLLRGLFFVVQVALGDGGAAELGVLVLDSRGVTAPGAVRRGDRLGLGRAEARQERQVLGLRRARAMRRFDLRGLDVAGLRALLFALGLEEAVHRLVALAILGDVSHACGARALGPRILHHALALAGALVAIRIDAERIDLHRVERFGAAVELPLVHLRDRRVALAHERRGLRVTLAL